MNKTTLNNSQSDSTADVDVIEQKKVSKNKRKSKRKKNGFRKLKVLSVIISILAFCFLYFFALPLHGSADAMGQSIGNTIGAAVGTAIGSYKGVTEGIAKGEVEGKSAGLDAKDTAVTISNKMDEIGKLDVLVADVRMDTANKVGRDPDSAVFYVFKANAIFSVDLKHATVQKNGDNNFYISLPQPEVDLSYDEAGSEELAKWQKHFWSGDSEAGYLDYLNSRREIDEKSVDEIANYETLIDRAKDSATTQISQLVKSICGEDAVVSIDFIESDQGAESNG